MGECVVNDRVITVPAFASVRGEVRHFFGTRQHSVGLNVQVGTPVPVTSFKGAARASWMLSVKQVHGTDALVVDRGLMKSDRFLAGWDALVTNQPGIMVAVRTADCVPVLIHDPQRRVVAAVHAGWRGAVAGIVRKTMTVMKSRFGSVPEHLQLSIGPSAGVCCYEVDEPVLEKLHKACPDSEQVVRSRRGSKAHLDLKLLIRQQALAAGVSPESITSVNVCTICHEDLFFSYRREGKVIGTMVSAIGLGPL